MSECVGSKHTTKLRGTTFRSFIIIKQKVLPKQENPWAEHRIQTGMVKTQKWL